MKKILFLLFVAFVTISSIAQKASVTKTVAPLCDSVLFHYSAVTNVVSGFATSFNWSRAAVTGIANAAGSGTNGVINEYLDNTTANPLLVKYAITMTENTGCLHTDSLFITINPTPHLSSALSGSICDSTAFSYTAATLTNNATYSWSRAAVTGIANAANSGVGSSVNEVLSNTTNDNVIVKYAFTISANGCSNTDTVYVTVHPTPFLVKLYHKPSSQKGEKNRWLRLHLEAVKNSSVFPDKQLGQG